MLGCTCWTKFAGVKNHFAPKGTLQHVQGAKATTSRIASCTRCGLEPVTHPACPFCPLLAGRRVILALGLPLCILPSGNVQQLGLLCPPTPCAPRQASSPSPGNKLRILMPPALHVTRALFTSMENVTFQSQSLLIEQQTLVAQTIPTIFDGWKIQYLVRLL